MTHDVGPQGALVLSAQKADGSPYYDIGAIVDGILKQRAQMTLDGTLHDANGKLIGRLKLKELGISDDHIAQIAALQPKPATVIDLATADKTHLIDDVEGQIKNDLPSRGI
jgi:hypothetical protein